MAFLRKAAQQTFSWQIRSSSLGRAACPFLTTAIRFSSAGGDGPERAASSGPPPSFADDRLAVNVGSGGTASAAGGGPRPGPFVGFTLSSAMPPGGGGAATRLGPGAAMGGASAAGAADTAASAARRGGMPGGLIAGAAASPGKRGRRSAIEAHFGIVHAHCSAGNTILTLTDVAGAAKAATSAGAQGFKGSKRGTNLAAQVASVALGRKARTLGFSHVAVYLKGLGRGRTAVARSLRIAGVAVRRIIDRTPVPHNGCRPPKKRRR